MKTLLLLAALMLINIPAFAAEPEDLVNRDCTRCHGSELYTRENRTVEFLADLELQVERCNINTKAGWSDDEADEVAEYLNEKYYHFK